jgi:hypothetical protein
MTPGEQRKIEIVISSDGNDCYEVKVQSGSTIYFHASLVRDLPLAESLILAACKEAYQEIIQREDPLMEMVRKV